ncbi:hypothetical protein [Pelagibacterium xiamenense]|uniref:hypothetical protein n=1 Tax=Pelagibacterium xiamenense TaxID=2901140 RepID=UPI001E4282AB|nr:hypothetical protein [Pelagibacterium xiamenense]MCD7059058.1 hypothetical protein [Pelagibacterium xiamenense]
MAETPDDPNQNEPGAKPGCSGWLLGAAALGVVVAIGASFSPALELSIFPLVVATLVYIGGAFVLVLLTANTALAGYSRWVLVALVPLPAAGAVWFVLHVTGF